MASKITEMTKGSPLNHILRFTFPLLLGNILQQTYSLIDAVIVGKFLGIDALASIGASTSVIFLILGFCNGCSSGFGIPIAQKFGAGDYSTMRKYISVSLQLTAIMSILIALVTCIFCSDILLGIRTPQNIFDDAFLYLLVTFIGIPFTFYYNLLSCVLRAIGDSKTPFLFLLLSTILNIFLDFFCILILDWGVLGAGIATVVSQGASALLCYIYMYKNFPILKEKSQKRVFDIRAAKSLLYIGIPMGLQFSITAIGSIMLQGANNALGTACVAAFTAGSRILMFFICAFESLGITMATYTGQNYGAGKPERIWKGVKVSMTIMLIYSLISFLIIIFVSSSISLLFVDAKEVEIIKSTVTFLHITGYFYPILGVLCILRYTIQGAGFINLAMLSGVFEMIARSVVGISLVPTFGFVAVCYGNPAAWVAADILLVSAYIYVYHKLNREKILLNIKNK